MFSYDLLRNMLFAGYTARRTEMIVPPGQVLNRPVLGRSLHQHVNEVCGQAGKQDRFRGENDGYRI